MNSLCLNFYLLIIFPPTDLTLTFSSGSNAVYAFAFFLLSPYFSLFSLLDLFRQFTKIKYVYLTNYAFESVVSELRRNISRSDPHYNSYISRVHDSLLRRALRGEQYLKLYSYHYLINGFAVFVTSQQV